MTQFQVPVSKLTQDGAFAPLGTVTVHRSSERELVLEGDLPLTLGDDVMMLIESEEFAGQISWSTGKTHGCMPVERLSAAESSEPGSLGLVRAPVDEVRVKARSVARRMAFAAYFAELRQRRGLTLANVAEAVGVSKPTVWAWENGKALPLTERLQQIADLVGVPLERLQRLIVSGDEVAANGGEKLPQDTVTECRRIIAEAYRLSPSAVRIIVEL